MIDAVNLTKKFGDVTAVDGLTFHVAEGEIFGFPGPNGAGENYPSTDNKLLVNHLPGINKMEVKT